MSYDQMKGSCVVQMVDITADANEGNLVPWHHCHRGEVVAADLNVDKQQVFPKSSCAPRTTFCLVQGGPVAFTSFA